MTVSEIRAWVVIKRDGAADGEIAMFNRLLYALDDWLAMREALERGINAYDAGGLARATLKTLRLKP